MRGVQCDRAQDASGIEIRVTHDKGSDENKRNRLVGNGRERKSPKQCVSGIVMRL